jgi:MYXO-CTERM domain-containing protein
VSARRGAISAFRVKILNDYVGPNVTGYAMYRWELQGETAQVPGPSTFVLLATGLVGLRAWRRRK